MFKHRWVDKDVRYQCLFTFSIGKKYLISADYDEALKKEKRAEETSDMEFTSDDPSNDKLLSKRVVRYFLNSFYI